MSNYGFNPDELIDTKVELIDKDGFHKVGEASDNNGGSSSEVSIGDVVSLSDIYLERGEYMQDVMFIIDKRLHPECDFDNLVHGGERVMCYTGELIDNSEIYIDWDELGAYIGNENDHDTIDTLSSLSASVESSGFAKSKSNYFVCTITLMPEFDMNSIEPGTPVHYVIALGTTDSMHPTFIQVTAPMPEIDWSVMDDSGNGG